MQAVSSSYNKSARTFSFVVAACFHISGKQCEWRNGFAIFRKCRIRCSAECKCRKQKFCIFFSCRGSGSSYGADPDHYILFLERIRIVVFSSWSGSGSPNIPSSVAISSAPSLQPFWCPTVILTGIIIFTFILLSGLEWAC